MVAFILQKENDTDHLRNEEKFRTTKPQESVELTVDNIKLSSNRDIGRNVSHMDHVLHTWVVYQKTCTTSVNGQIQEVTIEHIRSIIQLKRHFRVYATTKTVFVPVHKTLKVQKA
jgi:hypothetical protein